ncbi:chitosanase [Dactylosporangium darangshiense]|uniref:F5/8 type C domain-containing protein n=1 Tax=Dactylosporangium darangshiense TaxID=579108 RepID=A0ABP8DAS7_9ACTN
MSLSRRLVVPLAVVGALVAVPLTAWATSDAEAATDTLLSRGRPVSASSIEVPDLAADRAVDGNGRTRWGSEEGVDPQWIAIDLGSARSISRVRLRWETAFGRSYRVQISNDATTWNTVYETATGDGGIDDLTALSATGRYVRMYGTVRGTKWGYSLYEFEVYGTGSGRASASGSGAGSSRGSGGGSGSGRGSGSGWGSGSGLGDSPGTRRPGRASQAAPPVASDTPRPSRPAATDTPRPSSPAATPTPRPSSPAATPTSTGAPGAGLADPRKKEIAMQLVSSAENSTLDWRSQYGYIEDIGDGRGYTAGIIGFCSGTGDMLDLVEEYTRRVPGNALAKYLPALRRVNGTASHAGLDPGFTADWRAAAADPQFTRAQDDERDRVYFNPAVAQAKSDGLGTLGQFIYYDAMVMHGPGSDAESFGGIRRAALSKAKPPSQGGDESTYLNAFLDVRVAAMRAESAHSDTSRVDTAQREFLRAGNLALNTPLTWKVYGDSFHIA